MKFSVFYFIPILDADKPFSSSKKIKVQTVVDKEDALNPAEAVEAEVIIASSEEFSRNNETSKRHVSLMAHFSGKVSTWIGNQNSTSVAPDRPHNISEDSHAYHIDIEQK
jgi:hypothetical protein